MTSHPLTCTLTIRLRKKAEPMQILFDKELNTMKNDPIKRILEIFASRGNEKYADENVTQKEHALQCAALAIAEGESEAMVVAALLHDIGHIIGNEDLPADCDMNLDDSHEEIGHHFLHSHFVEEVTEPVKLHVSAKRYLSTVDPAYKDKLSPTSLKSFIDQGGVMDADELAEFTSNPFFDDAVRLRHWDDEAKKLDNPNLELKDFVKKIESVMLHANGN